MLKFIRILLAIVSHYDYEIQKRDVKTISLYASLLEIVYMTQPNGFTYRDGSKVYKLQRSIYGLKLAPRS